MRKALLALVVGFFLCVSDASTQLTNANQVVVVTVKLDTAQSVSGSIDKMVIQQGIMPRQASSTDEAEAELVQLDAARKVIHRTPFSFVRFMTVPLAEPGTKDEKPVPSVVQLPQPEATLIVPYLPNARFVEVRFPGQQKPAASKPISAAERKKKEQGYFFEPAPSQPGTLNILFLGSGFSAAEEGSFLNQVARGQNEILTYEPFKGRISKIVFRAVRSNSSLCQVGCFGIDRLLCCDNSPVISAALATGLPFDEIVVIHNTSIYSNGGYLDVGSYKTNSYSTFCQVYNGFWTPKAIAHELGHSFGSLLDEYCFQGECTPDKSVPFAVNCVSTCQQLSPWSSVCQLGCGNNTGYFRPEDSIMRGLTIPSFNRTSIESTTFPDGLRMRLQFFLQELQEVQPPRNHRVTVQGSTVTLQWDSPLIGPTPASYVIEAGSASGMADITSFNIGSSATSYQVANVPARTYFTRVYSVAGNATSAPSNETRLTVVDSAYAPLAATVP